MAASWTRASPAVALDVRGPCRLPRKPRSHLAALHEVDARNPWATEDVSQCRHVSVACEKDRDAGAHRWRLLATRSPHGLIVRTSRANLWNSSEIYEFTQSSASKRCRSKRLGTSVTTRDSIICPVVMN
jgi:hypothetical protein